MSEFTELQAALKAVRSERRIGRLSHLGAREKLKQAEQALVRFDRTMGDTSSEERLRQRLLSQRDEAASLARGLREKHREVSLREAELLERLAALADPQTQIEELSDAYPFLLFPVRLETRFRTGADGPQLWLRIYPDDCQVETFTEILSEGELRNVRAFWIAWWKAGGHEAQRRAAWRKLARAHGSGRATWLTSHYRPTNPSDEPVKSLERDIILVIAPEVDASDEERQAAAAYWVAVWRAGRDGRALALARQAFDAAVGAERAQVLAQHFRPANLDDEPPAPHTRGEVDVSVAVIRFPEGEQTSATSWLQAPRVSTLPDRFVCLLLSGGAVVGSALGRPVPGMLAVGPDPSLEPDEQIQTDSEGNLVINEELRWLTDFERAVEVGMAMKIPLTPQQASSGFDRLLVLGLRLSSDAEDGASTLERLLEGHHLSKNGFGVLPQGTPTNNTEGAASGYSWLDDADASYDRVFGGRAGFELTDDPLRKRDGQWLAELLGIDPERMRAIPHADGLDQAEARAMNTALWPSTWGYFLEEMMRGSVSPEDIELARSLYTNFVSGRGLVPPVRIGKQPYGIVTATAWSRLSFSPQQPFGAFLGRLQGLLSKMETDFRALLPRVPRVREGASPHQTLLDIVGLHPSSVEYHRRYAQSASQLYNQMALEVGEFWAGLLVGLLQLSRQRFLEELGLDPDARPPILDKVFRDTSILQEGPLVDDVPPSEVDPVRAYTPDGRNYLEWLAQASIEQIRTEDLGGPAPGALLYLYLRHGLMLSYWDTSRRLLQAHALPVPSALGEPDFLHVGAKVDGVSKWQSLYQAAPAVTGHPTMTIGQYIDLAGLLTHGDASRRLVEVKRAIEALARTPTARLERLLAEHMDCASYRLDAWKLSLGHVRLFEQRTRKRAPSRGVYLGAYGWLDEVRPERRELTRAPAPEDLRKVFPGNLLRDPRNAGYIHAPSLNQAATAAILRNAHLTHAGPDQQNPFSIDLSSERVRDATRVLEGLRRNQSLSALLGYQFERGLHDRYSLGQGQVDRFVYKLRRKFPLVTDRRLDTRPPPDAPIEQLEARNVIDGLALVARAREPGRDRYPFGFSTGTGPDDLPVASGPEAEALNAEVQRLLATSDAVADLMMAESVHQAVLGNFDRAAAAADVVGAGRYPQEPEVIRTPRSGKVLTHRVAVQLDTRASPSISPNSLADMTPRASAEPALNAWLSSMLPDPDDVAVSVRFTDAAGTERSVHLTQRELGLQPMDLLFVGALDGQQSMTELDDRIEHLVRTMHARHPGAVVRIDYTLPVEGKTSFFELAALVRSLRALALRSRPLRASDLVLAQEADIGLGEVDRAELAGRVEAARDALQALRVPLQALASDTALDPEAYAARVISLSLRAALHGLPQTGTGAIYRELHAIQQSVARKLEAVIARWERQHAECAGLMAGYGALASDAERWAQLQKAERLISTTDTFPLPDPDTFRGIVIGKQGDFEAALQGLVQLRTIEVGTLADYLDAVEPRLARIAAHDRLWFDADRQANDLGAERQALASLRATLERRVSALLAEIEARSLRATERLSLAAATASTEQAVGLLDEAARIVLGDEFVLLPRFALPDAPGLELERCIAASPSLLSHLSAGHAFPVDDWMYGVARVREKMAHWEHAVMLSEALGRGAELTPLQLPHQPGDRWAGLELGEARLEGEKLLYTAHFATPFDRSALQAGLLVDEWTEILPAAEETTGLAFHFDQPGSEPPQALLLVTPPALTGRWRWSDVVDAVNETRELAALRALEPAHLDSTPYAQFVPATTMAVSRYLIHIVTDLAANVARAAEEPSA